MWTASFHRVEIKLIKKKRSKFNQKFHFIAPFALLRLSTTPSSGHWGRCNWDSPMWSSVIIIVFRHQHQNPGKNLTDLTQFHQFINCWIAKKELSTFCVWVNKSQSPNWKFAGFYQSEIELIQFIFWAMCSLITNMSPADWCSFAYPDLVYTGLTPTFHTDVASIYRESAGVIHSTQLTNCFLSNIWTWYREIMEVFGTEHRT